MHYIILKRQFNSNNGNCSRAMTSKLQVLRICCLLGQLHNTSSQFSCGAFGNLGSCSACCTRASVLVAAASSEPTCDKAQFDMQSKRLAFPQHFSFFRLWVSFSFWQLMKDRRERHFQGSGDNSLQLPVKKRFILLCVLLWVPGPQQSTLE